jgi:hypothetical protein
MYASITASPVIHCKYRVTLANKQSIDFGAMDIPDFTEHRNSALMREHLVRKGAIVPNKVLLETDPVEIQRGMLYVNESSNENWEDVHTEEYWDRWLLWSYTDINLAKMWMTMRNDILFVPSLETKLYHV